MIWDVGSANINIPSVQHYRPGRQPGGESSSCQALRATWPSRGQDQPNPQPGLHPHHQVRVRAIETPGLQHSSTAQLRPANFITLLYLQLACHPENDIRFSFRSDISLLIFIFSGFHSDDRGDGWIMHSLNDRIIENLTFRKILNIIEYIINLLWWKKNII